MMLAKIAAVDAMLVFLTVMIIVAHGPRALAKCLLREPPDIVTPPHQTDAGFYLEISGKPKYYDPGHLYTVSLRVSQHSF